MHPVRGSQKNELTEADDEDMLPEYDFSGGTRGKYFRAMQAGYTITVHREDGTTTVKTSLDRPQRDPRSSS